MTNEPITAGRAARERAARMRAQRRRRRLALVVAAVVVVALVVGGVVAFAFTPASTPRPAAAPVVTAPPASAPPPAPAHAVATRSAIAAENAKPGTSAWRIPPMPVFGISGYADHTSVQRGDTLTLFVDSFFPTYRIEAYRMGWYQGLGGRLVWKSGAVSGSRQPKPRFVSATRTVVADWKPSFHLTVPADWPPGDYLLKLVDDVGASYVPVTVRDDSSHAAVIVVNAVTTWQAYNDFGGYSLYHGTRGSGETRSTVASFDRPYARDGAGDFIANELGFVTLAERMGLDVTYITDVDMHARPELLRNHILIVSLGHDEYWSKAMRDGVEAARDHGVNVMFLGANALYRRIRLEPSPLGPDRLEVNYRGVAGDRTYQRTHEEPTSEWRSPPQARPENSLTGTFYECNPVNVDGVVADGSSWVFAGTGLKTGDHLPLLIGTEYDRVTPDRNTPKNIHVLLHSPLRCQGNASFADAAYYTTPSGAGVFDAGTGAWVCKLFSGCPADRPFAPNPLIQRVTENLLRVFAAGPVGRVHPSENNLASLPKRAVVPGRTTRHIRRP